ncbi:hypothetical protein NDU88_002229 [Pleurodeles waltl]|uniref:Uncharacterized protein n=1 Tax=Pleurodeles waltl TaxID=8319 RepID=A0AAV7TJY8_PLEWA|nr:hypothetical protein NDU88_002229 [Pleurodeles waltl]
MDGGVVYFQQGEFGTTHSPADRTRATAASSGAAGDLSRHGGLRLCVASPQQVDFYEQLYEEQFGKGGVGDGMEMGMSAYGRDDFECGMEENVLDYDV